MWSIGGTQWLGQQYIDPAFIVPTAATQEGRNYEENSTNFNTVIYL